MNVLFICTGNTCRSPMAEAYLKSKNLPDVKVKSRGIAAANEPVSQNSVTVMGELGINLKGYESEPLEMTDLSWADKIICMSLSHLTVLSMYTNKEKISVLGEGIPDPYGCGVDLYRECRNEIAKAIDKLIKEDFFFEAFVVSMQREHVKEIAKLEKICFSMPWSEEGILESFVNGTKFFVAVKGSKVLGYLGISCILDEGYITNVAVFPEYRKMGIGNLLINRVISLAKDESLSFISLEVRESNLAAISLYEKHGFKTEGKRRNFYKSPNEDALIMTKRFE